MAANNPGNLRDSFEERVDYYEFGTKTPREIEEDLARDRAKWPIRTFTITGEIQAKKLSNSTWEVSFPVEYILLNRERQAATGSLRITLICEEPALRIRTVKREVLKAKKSLGN